MTVLARLGRRLNSAGFATFERLKWATIVLPFVALLVLLALLRSHLHDWLHESPGVFFLVGLFAVCVFSFASIVFALVEAQEARILAQNRMFADLLERTERQNVELSALLSVSRASASSVEPTSMYDEALGAILAVTAAETVQLWLAEAGFLSLVTTKGDEVISSEERTRLRFGEGLAGEAASRGSAVVVRGPGGDPRVEQHETGLERARPLCALPLRLRGETVGVLVVTAKNDAAFAGPDDLRVLEGIGDQIALGVENMRLHEQVLDRAVLEERERIARELHDGLAQVLGFINTQSQAARKLLADGRIGDAVSELEAMSAASREVYADVREAIVGLRGAPKGLIPTIRDYLERLPRTGNCTIELRVQGDAEHATLAPPTEIQLVRIVQEALSNMRKHAQASRVEVIVDADAQTLSVEIADDGRGFDPLLIDHTGWPRFGLQTMRERALAIGGTFEIVSDFGKGSSVSVRVPRVREREAVGASAAG